MKKTVFISFVCAIILSLTGCSSSKIIDYKGNKYEFCENPRLDYRNTDPNRITSKIGDFKGSEVFSIEGLSQENWIELKTQSMSDSPVGLYKSAILKIESVSDFKANALTIYENTVNTKDTNGTEIKVYNTNEINTINKIVLSIQNGKPLHVSELDKVKVDKQYNLEFQSSDFPHLVYCYDYIESKDGRYYLSFEEKAIEINDVLKKLFSN